jgi:hypothetical protein
MYDKKTGETAFSIIYRSILIKHLISFIKNVHDIKSTNFWGVTATFCGLLDPENEVTAIILSDNYPPDLAPHTRRPKSKDCVMHSGTYVLTHQRNLLLSLSGQIFV